MTVPTTPAPPGPGDPGYREYRRAQDRRLLPWAIVVALVGAVILLVLLAAVNAADEHVEDEIYGTAPAVVVEDVR